MLLFLTRDALFKFSMEDRLAGAGEGTGSKGLRTSRAGEFWSRPCQNIRGELVLLKLNGDDPAGEESFFIRLPLIMSDTIRYRVALGDTPCLEESLESFV